MIPVAVADSWFFWLATIGVVAGVYILPTVIAIARQVDGLGEALIRYSTTRPMVGASSRVAKLATTSSRPERPCVLRGDKRAAVSPARPATFTTTACKRRGRPASPPGSARRPRPGMGAFACPSEGRCFLGFTG